MAQRAGDGWKPRPDVSAEWASESQGEPMRAASPPRRCKTTAALH